MIELTALLSACKRIFKGKFYANYTITEVSLDNRNHGKEDILSELLMAD